MDLASQSIRYTRAALLAVVVAFSFVDLKVATGFANLKVQEEKGLVRLEMELEGPS